MVPSSADRPGCARAESNLASAPSNMAESVCAVPKTVLSPTTWLKGTPLQKASPK